MESQSHGNQFEDLILFEITGLTKEQYQPLLKGGYTAPMDIERGIHSDHNYSIKTSKNGKTIGCGDILRFRTHCSSTEFKLLVGAWRQSSVSTKTYTGIYEFNISPSVENLLWGNLTTEAMMPFVSYVKAIPPGKQAQTVHLCLMSRLFHPASKLKPCTNKSGSLGETSYWINTAAG